MENKVDVYLYDLPLTERTDDFFGRVRTKGIFTNKGVAEEIKLGGSEYTIESLESVINIADRIRAEKLVNGYTIHSGFVNASLGVNGVFTDKVFNASEHLIKANYSETAELRKQIKETKVEVLGIASTGIEIISIKDKATGEINTSLTPNKGIIISGDKLMIQANPEFEKEVGVFFIKVADQTKTKVEDVLINRNKELVAIVPT